MAPPKGTKPWNKGTMGLVEPNSGSFKKGMIPWNKGKAKEQYPQLSNSGVKKGNVPWSKGKKGVMPIPWNKGKSYKNASISKFLMAKWEENEYRTKQIEAHIGNKGYWKGKKLSLDHKNKLSKSHIGILKGSKNPAWKGGKSFEPYSSEFNRQLKELIRQRDNYQCQKCGCPERENIRKLSVHHVDYNKKNCLPSNLISLCASCNNEVNINREYWTKYFREILNGRLKI